MRLRYMGANFFFPDVHKQGAKPTLLIRKHQRPARARANTPAAGGGRRGAGAQRGGIRDAGLATCGAHDRLERARPPMGLPPAGLSEPHADGDGGGRASTGNRVSLAAAGNPGRSASVAARLRRRGGPPVGGVQSWVCGLGLPRPPCQRPTVARVTRHRPAHARNVPTAHSPAPPATGLWPRHSPQTRKRLSFDHGARPSSTSGRPFPAKQSSAPQVTGLCPRPTPPPGRTPFFARGTRPRAAGAQPLRAAQ